MIVVKWLMFISVLLIAFDIAGYFEINPVTGRFLDDPLWLNDLAFAIVRFFAYLAWAAPLFYLFWPQIVTRKRGRQNMSENLNKRTIAGHTLPSGMLSTYLDDEQYGGSTRYLKPDSDNSKL